MIDYVMFGFAFGCVFSALFFRFFLNSEKNIAYHTGYLNRFDDAVKIK